MPAMATYVLGDIHGCFAVRLDDGRAFFQETLESRAALPGSGP